MSPFPSQDQKNGKQDIRNGENIENQCLKPFVWIGVDSDRQKT